MPSLYILAHKVNPVIQSGVREAMNLSSLGRHRQAPGSSPEPRHPLGSFNHYFFASLLRYFFFPFAFFLFSTTTCAAASRDIGTRNGEALT